jgi:chromosome segregation ATPase
MSILVSDPLILGLLTFLAGLVVAKISTFLNTRGTVKESSANDRLLRSLEADLRVANKNLAKVSEELHGTKGELDSTQGTVAELQTLLDERAKAIEETSAALKRECEKTNSLREDLTVRAEETIRAQVHARQAEVELSVVKAGTTAVHEEIDRLAAERHELTGRLHQLEDKMRREKSSEEDGREETFELDEPLVGF